MTKYYINGTDEGLRDLEEIGRKLEEVGHRICPDCEDHDFIQCGMSVQFCGVTGWDDEVMDMNLGYLDGGVPFVTVKQVDGGFEVEFNEEEAAKYKE